MPRTPDFSSTYSPAAVVAHASWPEERVLRGTLADIGAKVAGEQIRFNEGESIWTESSYKYDEARLGGLANESGFLMTRLWTNAARQFWVAFLTAP